MIDGASLLYTSCRAAHLRHVDPNVADENHLFLATSLPDKWNHYRVSEWDSIGKDSKWYINKPGSTTAYYSGSDLPGLFWLGYRSEASGTDNWLMYKENDRVLSGTDTGELYFRTKFTMSASWGTYGAISGGETSMSCPVITTFDASGDLVWSLEARVDKDPTGDFVKEYGVRLIWRDFDGTLHTGPWIAMPWRIFSPSEGRLMTSYAWDVKIGIPRANYPWVNISSVNVPEVGSQTYGHNVGSFGIFKADPGISVLGGSEKNGSPTMPIAYYRIGYGNKISTAKP